MVFKQDRFTVDLGFISDRIQNETIECMKDKPVMLFLPATYDDAMNGPVMGNIIKVINSLQRRHGCFDQVVLGLDGADTKAKFRKVYKKFSIIPRSVILWNDSPEMKVLFKKLAISTKSPLTQGKGRNMWIGLGYRFAAKRGAAFVLHDCDIKPAYYNRSTILSLIAPIVHPKIDFDFSKAYYKRLTISADGSTILSGRVTRLLVSPLIDALRHTYGFNSEVRTYLDSLQAFNYSLSGEFAMTSDMADLLRVQADWGLEIGTLNFLHSQKPKIAQVNLGLYDHKHSGISAENPLAGLNKMAEEVTKTILRKIFSMIGNILMSDKRFRMMLFDYEKYAEHYITSYRALSANKGWEYDHIKELERIRTFKESITRAFNSFKENPEEIRPLLHWDEVDKRYREELLDIIYKYNP